MKKVIRTGSAIIAAIIAFFSTGLLGTQPNLNWKTFLAYHSFATVKLGESRSEVVQSLGLAGQTNSDHTLTWSKCFDARHYATATVAFDALDRVSTIDRSRGYVSRFTQFWLPLRLVQISTHDEKGDQGLKHEVIESFRPAPQEPRS